MRQAWHAVDFGIGKVLFLDETRKEDMLQVEYPNRFLLDMGWYQDRWILFVVQDFDWEHPVKQYTATDENQLPELLKAAVRCAEQASHSTYGASGQTMAP